MPRCHCDLLMVRADLYDPEGTIPLYGMVTEDGYLWVCTNHGRSPENAVAPMGRSAGDYQKLLNPDVT